MFSNNLVKLKLGRNISAVIVLILIAEIITLSNSGFNGNASSLDPLVVAITLVMFVVIITWFIFTTQRCRKAKDNGGSVNRWRPEILIG